MKHALSNMHTTRLLDKEGSLVTDQHRVPKSMAYPGIPPYIITFEGIRYRWHSGLNPVVYHECVPTQPTDWETLIALEITDND